MDYMNDLHELCESISREIADANEKIRKAGGKLSAGDVDYIDKLTHTLKSLKTTVAMMEAEEDGYSQNNYDGGYNGGNYNGGNSYGYRGGNSYARGRGRNANRDSMGRYSSGYSRNGDFVEQLHELMQDAPNDQIRKDIQRLADKVEQSM